MVILSDPHDHSQTAASETPTPNEQPLPAPPSLTSSTSTLRFPKPQGNQHLANWVSDSSPDIRQLLPSMSETGSLADSAYEIINNTDSESQDGLLSESTGSLEVPQPDDVQSLDGSDAHYDSDSDDESNNSSHASSIKYADQALQNPSSQVPTSILAYGPPSRSESPEIVTDTIKFDEDIFELQGSTGSVIRGICLARQLTPEDSSAVARQLSLPVIPAHIDIMVHQAMSDACLSTKQTFHLLYIGASAAQRSIVLKISNAIWASPKNGEGAESLFGRHREGVYNIVPISSFGPTPELDLMEASGYQIKVEHCTAASYVEQEDGPATYAISLDGKTITTTLSPEGSTTQPQWTRPHMAVFYCADDEDEQAEQTREAAWKLMKATEIPFIFVSESEAFSLPNAGRWKDYVNTDAPHLTLESTDGTDIPRQVYPIDFASFSNIDARQMNRNLAHMTGLLERPDESDNLKGKLLSTATSSRLDLKKVWGKRPSRQQILRNVDRNTWAVALLVPILMAIFTPLLSTLLGSPLSNIQSIQEHPLSDVLGVSPHTHTIPTRANPTSTTTVVINVTSTKTIRISHAQPSTSTLASALSFAGFLSDKPSSVPTEPEAKKTVCSVRIHSKNEVLVVLPSANKASWLAKGAIDIDVYRGSEPIKTKISSVDEGVLVEVDQKDAHGSLNVSVVTTRKPRINETFEVDFGKAAVVEAFEAGLHILQDLAQKVYSTVDEAVNVVEDKHLPDVSKLRKDAASAWEHAVEAGRNQYEGARDRVKDSLGTNVKGAREMMSRHLLSAKKIRDEADLSILKAQINSKLWWLKVQGKMDEFAEYQRNATLFLKAKHAEILLRKKGQEESLPKKTCGRLGKWNCGRSQKDGKACSGKDRRWNKLIMG